MSFDESYFQRYYGRPETRVQSPEEIGHLVRALTSLFDWWRVPLCSVLDVGAGTGDVGGWLRAHRPEVQVRSTDVSEYACRTYGHEQRDIASWQSGDRYDLVVCRGVLGYLDDAACAAAIDNLAAMTGSFLYLTVPTSTDVERGLVDRERSDLSIRLRPASFYLNLLSSWYFRVGAGLFLINDAYLPLYALERLD
jgi:hypothetical protein